MRTACNLPHGETMTVRSWSRIRQIICQNGSQVVNYDYDRAERFRLTGGASARGIARSRPAPRSGMVVVPPPRSRAPMPSGTARYGKH
eukprot:scaffold6618_cov139-Isochrysis_galbana.AAC.10